MALALLYPKHMRLTGVSSRSTSEWTRELPVLEGRGVTLRELRLDEGPMEEAEAYRRLDEWAAARGLGG